MCHAKAEAAVQLRPCQKGRTALRAWHSPGFIYPTVRFAFLQHHDTVNLCSVSDLLKAADPYLWYCCLIAPPHSTAVHFFSQRVETSTYPHWMAAYLFQSIYLYSLRSFWMLGLPSKIFAILPSLDLHENTAGILSCLLTKSLFNSSQHKTDAVSRFQLE